MLDYFADFVLRHCMLVQRARRGPREGRRLAAVTPGSGHRGDRSRAGLAVALGCTLGSLDVRVAVCLSRCKQ